MRTASMDEVFEAFRCCVSDMKCKGCEWEPCRHFSQKKVEIPVTLALDVIEMLKEHNEILCLATKPEPRHSTPRCAVCGTLAAYGQRFCGECGGKIFGGDVPE